MSWGCLQQNIYTSVDEGEGETEITGAPFALLTVSSIKGFSNAFFQQVCKVGTLISTIIKYHYRLSSTFEKISWNFFEVNETFFLR